MSEYRVKLSWENTTGSMDNEKYPRDHKWHFPNGIVIDASAAPDYQGNDALIDPEEAFIASISSCHMLTFIAICSKNKITVLEYTDDATGLLEKNQDGKMSVTKATLRPRVKFDSEANITPEEVSGIHESAHKYCFIANSVKTDITVEHQE